MTRVRIPAPDIDEDVTAEQLADYARGPAPMRARLIATFDTFSRREIVAWICKRAEEEGRHPSAVLADIVGPAVGVVGARCRGEEDREQKIARARCHVRMASARHREEQTEQEARRAAWEAAHSLVETADDSAAHGAGEESEER